MGLCLLFLGDWSRAKTMFAFINDLAIDCKSLGHAMESFELIGRALE